jgi:D-alanine-D-alanine ligase
VLRGGPSSEYEVSLTSGAEVLKQLPEQYHGLDVFIDRSGIWHFQGRREEPHRVLGKVDAVWNALHGEYGEDGGVQRILEEYHIPFSGSRRVASALATSKTLTKQILAAHGIKTPYGKLLRREDIHDFHDKGKELYRTFPQPSIIKPVARGASVGVSFARTAEEIAYALDLAFFCGDAVLVEEYVDGVEVVGGVVEGFRKAALYHLLPVEVMRPSGAAFLDHQSRVSDTVRSKVPAGVSRAARADIQRLSEAAHRALGLRHYSTADFIVHPKRGIYLLEIDALPALSAHSPLAVSLEAVGAPLSQFLDHILSHTLQRSAR